MEIKEEIIKFNQESKLFSFKIGKTKMEIPFEKVEWFSLSHENYVTSPFSLRYIKEYKRYCFVSKNFITSIGYTFNELKEISK